MVQDTFRRFAEERIRPIAEEVHRNNEDIPEGIIEGLSEIGTFGVSIPEEYDGFAAEGEGEYLSMVVATEELSRGSLGVGGSLVTRPEILARALLAGGTEDRRRCASAGEREVIKPPSRVSGTFPPKFPNRSISAYICRLLTDRGISAGDRPHYVGSRRIRVRNVRRWSRIETWTAHGNLG